MSRGFFSRSGIFEKIRKISDGKTSFYYRNCWNISVGERKLYVYIYIEGEGPDGNNIRRNILLSVLTTDGGHFP